MALITLDGLRAMRGPMLGIDPGTKTFGLSISDPTRLIASPAYTIKRKKFSKDAAEIFALYDDKACTAMVIGYPLNMDGSAGPRAQSTRDLAANLIAVRDVPVLLWDERLTSAAVTRTLLDADTSRAARAENIDKLASAYMLQGVLDALKS